MLHCLQVDTVYKLGTVELTRVRFRLFQTICNPDFSDNEGLVR